MPADPVLQAMIDAPETGTLRAWIDEGGPSSVRGAAGSSTHLLAAALRAMTNRPVVLLVAHLDDADEVLDELEVREIEVARFPAMEVLPGESNVNLELLSERLRLVRRLYADDAPGVIVAPIAAMMQGVPPADGLDRVLRVIRPGDQLDSMELAAWLDAAGYTRAPSLDGPGDFAIRGGIIDIFPPGGVPARIDLFGDDVEGLFEVDLDTMGSDRRLEVLELAGATAGALQSDHASVNIAALLPAASVVLLAELVEIVEQGRSYFERASGDGVVGPPAVLAAVNERAHAVMDVNQFGSGAAPERSIALPIRGLPAFDEEASTAVGELVELASSGRVVTYTQKDGETERLGEMLAEREGGARVETQQRYLHRGFIWGEGEQTIAAVPHHELLHRFHTRRRGRRMSGGRAMDQFVEMQVGDYVVHRDHGIAKFTGLKMMTPTGGGAAEEFLTLEFSGGAKVHVPATKIELVRKYVGAAGKPELSKVGGKRWNRQKEKVQDAVRDLAGEMLRVQAARESMPGVAYPADTHWQREFEAEFPYEETEDQLAAISAVKRDQQGTRPMDRLVCGDVGFGKTEVAIRAAFKTVEYGRQVAVLVPTTVLAEQHDRTFRERFADFPFRVEALSRFRTRAEQTRILKDVKAGRVDIVVGTHRLLSQDVHFADLGLVVIDEEQRFGVEHKQRLLEFRMTADVLTMSATPIPRTLHMALLGLRDISSLTTPPADRRAIVTEVLHSNPHRIRHAIERELAREGQVFFVHNRVHNIKSVADDVRQLAPDARVLVGHGQMPPKELEKVMLAFMRREADILVSTTIIESGIDIPTANTMFINDAQNFGLAELHQLRGRVGRYKHRAYCYLLLPADRTLSEVAVKRLKAIENFSMLGAGFKIALRDLEIRGAGNLLGPEQSGHITAVGYDMYCQLLEEAVAELRNEPTRRAYETTLEIGISGALPKGYIPSDTRRMEAYRRINQADSLETLRTIEQGLESAYGEPPKSARRLLELAEVRLGAHELGVRSMVRQEQDIIIRTADPGALEAAMEGGQGTLRMVGAPSDDGITSVYWRPPAAFFQGNTLLTVLRRRLVAAPAETAHG